MAKSEEGLSTRFAFSNDWLVLSKSQIRNGLTYNEYGAERRTEAGQRSLTRIKPSQQHLDFDEESFFSLLIFFFDIVPIYFYHYLNWKCSNQYLIPPSDAWPQLAYNNLQSKSFTDSRRALNDHWSKLSRTYATHCRAQNNLSDDSIALNSILLHIHINVIT